MFLACASLAVAEDKTEQVADKVTPTAKSIANSTPIDPSLQLQSLVYFPHAHQTLAELNYQFSLSENDTIENDASTQVSTGSTTYTQASFSFLYGFSNRLRFGISETDLIQQSINTTTTSTGVTKIDNSAGITDPQLSLIYRFRQNLRENFFEDISLQCTPQLATHEAANAGQIGNNVSIQSSTTLSLPTYWIVNENDFELNPQVTYHAQGFSQGQGGAASVGYGPYLSEALALVERSHFSKEFYLQPTVTVNFASSYTQTNQSTGLNPSVVNNFAVNPQLQFGYLLRPWWLLTTTISYSNSSSAKTTANGGTDLTVNNDSVAVISMHMIF